MFPWESVSVDFITHLLETKLGHTALCVFVDRLTKMIIVESTIDKIIIAEVATLYSAPSSGTPDFRRPSSQIDTPSPRTATTPFPPFAKI